MERERKVVGRGGASACWNHLDRGAISVLERVLAALRILRHLRRRRRVSVFVCVCVCVWGDGPAQSQTRLFSRQPDVCCSVCAHPANARPHTSTKPESACVGARASDGVQRHRPQAPRRGARACAERDRHEPGAADNTTPRTLSTTAARGSPPPLSGCTRTCVPSVSSLILATFISPSFRCPSKRKTRHHLCFFSAKKDGGLLAESPPFFDFYVSAKTQKKKQPRLRKARPRPGMDPWSR